MKRNIGVVNKHSNFRNKKGITLIALIITIIVLLILAGVSIATITGENGLLERARVAIEKTEQAETDENSKISNYENEIDNYNTLGRAGEVQSNAKKDILFTGTINTANQTAEFNTSGYDFFLVTFCWSSPVTSETFIIPSEDKNITQLASRYSDSSVTYYSTYTYTITDAGIKLNSIFKSNVTGYISRVIGVKI